MTNTRTRSRNTRATSRNSRPTNRIARSAANMADLVPAELGKQAMRLKRRIRRTRDLVRQHPRTSMAILVVGAGLLAGLIVGLAARARQQPQGLMSVILPR